jgi:uncharacterized repeat protein (TIGR03806 family)
VFSPLRSVAAPLAAAFAAAALGGCGSDGGEACGTAPDTGVYVDVTAPACDQLSSHQFFTGLAADGTPVLNEGMVPYEMSTPLFSDYTLKYRSIYMPPGAAPVPWRATAETATDLPFDFPVGTVITKTFAVPLDLRDPGLGVHLIETRLMVHTPTGWTGRTYIWDEAQTDARHESIGEGNVHLEWIHTDGELRYTDGYEIPNEVACRRCHAGVTGSMGLIGPRVPALIRQVTYGDGGPADQLEAWQQRGLIEAPPAGLLDEVPAFPLWHEDGQPVADPGTVVSDGEALDRHVRAYMDANCASCHNPDGDTRGAGLDLRYHVDDVVKLGVCKRPFAAGSEAQGGRTYDIVPGDPEASVLVFRIESEFHEWDHANRRMPPLARSLRHDEAADLIRAWVTWLATAEAAERYPGLDVQTCF